MFSNKLLHNNKDHRKDYVCDELKLTPKSKTEQFLMDKNNLLGNGATSLFLKDELNFREISKHDLNHLSETKVIENKNITPPADLVIPSSSTNIINIEEIKFPTIDNKIPNNLANDDFREFKRFDLNILFEEDLGDFEEFEQQSCNYDDMMEDRSFIKIDEKINDFTVKQSLTNRDLSENKRNFQSRDYLQGKKLSNRTGFNNILAHEFINLPSCSKWKNEDYYSFYYGTFRGKLSSFLENEFEKNTSLPDYPFKYLLDTNKRKIELFSPWRNWKFKRKRFQDSENLNLALNHFNKLLEKFFNANSDHYYLFTMLVTN